MYVDQSVLQHFMAMHSIREFSVPVRRFSPRTLSISWSMVLAQIPMPLNEHVLLSRSGPKVNLTIQIARIAEYLAKLVWERIV